MDRGATATFLTELAKDYNRPAHLIEAAFGSGTLYLTDAAVNITWNGNTYNSARAVTFSGLTEDRRPIIQRATFQVSGVDQVVIGILLADDYLGRPVRVYKALLDADFQVLSGADPILVFAGDMDAPAIAVNPDDGTATVSIGASNALADFERRHGRHTNDADQKLFFPSDKGMEFAGTLPDKIFWGKVSPLAGPALPPSIPFPTGGFRF